MSNKELTNYSLAGSLVLLGLALLSLCLIAMVAPVPGLAAPMASLPHSHGAQAAIEATTTTTSTVFVPLVTYQETATNQWTAEYYDDPSLTDPPKYTTEEARIDYDWGEDAPGGLPDDFFSIRWTGDWDFEVGEYTFIVYADDGVRLWLDDDLLVDAWTAGMGEHDATRIIGTAGPHHLKVEYFERLGDAAVQLQWRRTDLYPRWHGDYYDEPWVENLWRYEQTDSVIQFDWGEGCPDGLDCLHFSVAWEATPVFEPGTHRINLYGDEGYQLLIDGAKVQEAGWEDDQHDGGEDDWYDLAVSGTEYHEITYNFHDRGGPAEARLWIENLALPVWTAEYYANTTLSGDPAATEQEPAVFFDWGLGRPHRNLPRDNFSIRFSGQRYFHSGFYRFGLFADDAVRMWLDGEPLVNEWHAGRGEYHSLLTYVSTGYHNVVIEYYELGGEAEIRYWWE
ncbi:PA14 domain-containing protein [Chloroflexota bacterium]